MTALTRELAQFLHRLNAAQLTDELLDRAKYLLLDYLAVSIRGSRSDSSQAVYRMVSQSGSSGSCTVIGTQLSAPPGLAALANGNAAHSIELDDTHQAGSIHLGVVMFPVAMALSEYLEGVRAPEFFAAVVAGYEAAARIAMAVGPKQHYELGFHPTATCGVFGAAVTAAKLLKLSHEQMLSALGIAGSMAAGSLEFLAEGAWTKRLHAGLAAQNGIQAALLAGHGFRGPSTILEGRDGFLAGYSRQPDPEAITRGLGDSFELLRTSVKPHACCRYMQSSIDALIELARQYDLRPEQVLQTEVAVLEAGWPLVAEPPQRKYNPENVVDAQFSMPFGAATALLNRSAGIDQFTDEMLRSPEIKRLMGRVVLTKDPRIEKNFPMEWRARVAVHLQDGKHYENYLRFPKGDPENPLSWQELATKFRTLIAPVFPADRRDEIERTVRSLSPASDLRSLWRLTTT